MRFICLALIHFNSIYRLNFLEFSWRAVEVFSIRIPMEITSKTFELILNSFGWKFYENFTSWVFKICKVLSPSLWCCFTDRVSLLKSLACKREKKDFLHTYSNIFPIQREHLSWSLRDVAFDSDETSVKFCIEIYADFVFAFIASSFILYS